MDYSTRLSQALDRQIPDATLREVDVRIEAAITNAAYALLGYVDPEAVFESTIVLLANAQLHLKAVA